ncbi:hypothetical protein [Kribbella sp. CA-294648]|uniref:hypothetical protein n=1 Tax=Kribbella sp. CA-294648 TaxID=3239948 RepID=UPI003D8ED827
MVYQPMSRRAIGRFAGIAVASTVVGLLLRPVNIGAAVWAFLLAVGMYGMVGYGVLDRLVDRWNRSRAVK